MTTATKYKYEITNTCTCTVYDEETGDYTNEPSMECFGDCWEFAIEEFEQDTDTFRQSNTTGWWKVSNLGLWDGDHSGYFYADPNNVIKIIEGMTVNSAWIMRYTPYDDRVEYSLSHHDSMGSSTIIFAVTKDEQEELGLY